MKKEQEKNYIEIWYKTENLKITFNSATEILTIQTKTQQKEFDTFYDPQGVFDIEKIIYKLFIDNPEEAKKEFESFFKTQACKALLEGFDLYELDYKLIDKVLNYNINNIRKVINYIKNEYMDCEYLNKTKITYEELEKYINSLE